MITKETLAEVIEKCTVEVARGSRRCFKAGELICPDCAKVLGRFFQDYTQTGGDYCDDVVVVAVDCSCGGHAVAGDIELFEQMFARK